MGLLDDAKKAIGMGQAKKVDNKPGPKPKKTPKEIATEAGEPWVNVLSVEVDPENPGNGAFEKGGIIPIDGETLYQAVMESRIS